MKNTNMGRGDLSLEEIRGIEPNVRIKIDSVFGTEEEIRTIVYKFSKGQIQLNGLAKVIYSDKFDKIVTINCVVSDEELKRRKGEIHLFFEKVKLYN